MKRKDSLGQKQEDERLQALSGSDRETRESKELEIDPTAIIEYLDLMNDFIKNSIPEEMREMQNEGESP